METAQEGNVACCYEYRRLYFEGCILEAEAISREDVLSGSTKGKSEIKNQSLVKDFAPRQVMTSTKVRKHWMKLDGEKPGSQVLEKWDRKSFKLG